MKIRHREDYRRLRRQAYPDIGDQLDAVRALADSLRKQGIALPAETLAWLDDLDHIKARYKKPTTEQIASKIPEHTGEQT